MGAARPDCGVIDRGTVIGEGTPAALKGQSANHLRIEITFEPSRDRPEMPAFVTGAVLGGRRMLGLVEAGVVGEAVAWAQSLQTVRIVEEFSIGPTTLEDACAGAPGLRAWRLAGGVG